MDLNTGWMIAGAIFSAGTAWGGAKYALNGTRERVKTLEANQAQVMDRLARVETKIDLLLEHRGSAS